MNAQQIRELVKTREDWKHLRRFDRDQPFTGMSSVGWLAIAHMSQKITKQQRRAYFAALKLIQMVHKGQDAAVTNWWKIYKREHKKCGSPASR